MDNKYIVEIPENQYENFATLLEKLNIRRDLSSFIKKMYAVPADKGFKLFGSLPWKLNDNFEIITIETKNIFGSPEKIEQFKIFLSEYDIEARFEKNRVDISSEHNDNFIKALGCVHLIFTSSK